MYKLENLRIVDLHCTLALETLFPLPPAHMLDPAYQAPVPNLDEVAGRSEHVIVVDVKDLPAEQPRSKFMEDGDN